MTELHPGRSDQSDARRDAMLAQKFVALADTLVADFDIVELMDTLIEACVELQVVVCSSDETWLLELFQLQTGEGPCLDCVRASEPLTVEAIGARPENRFSA